MYEQKIFNSHKHIEAVSMKRIYIKQSQADKSSIYEQNVLKSHRHIEAASMNRMYSTIIGI